MSIATALQVGHTVAVSRTFTQEDFNRFAALSGDDNPIHVDPQFSARTRFGRTVCHGMLLYGTICGVMSTHFPGLRQLEQELMFPNPTFVDEEVTIQLQVVEVWPGAHVARLRTLITKANNEVACEGQMLVCWKNDE
ncbi:MAG: MaoC family dehydratase [Ktedonobacteraceae bacterium]|nr:MaoC family dehydratase [Ktedonobacteraceae bacterium]